MIINRFESFLNFYLHYSFGASFNEQTKLFLAVSIGINYIHKFLLNIYFVVYNYKCMRNKIQTCNCIGA